MDKSVSIRDVAEVTYIVPGTFLKKCKVDAIIVKVGKEGTSFKLFNHSAKAHKELRCESTSSLVYFVRLITPNQLIIRDARALSFFQENWVSEIKEITVENIISQQALMNFLQPARCPVLLLVSHCPIELDQVISAVRCTSIEVLVIKGVDDSILPAVITKHTLHVLGLDCGNVRLIELKNNRMNAVSIDTIVWFIQRVNFAPSARLHIENVAGTREDLEMALGEIMTPSKQFIAKTYRQYWQSRNYLFTANLNVTIRYTSDEYRENGIPRF